jgi:SAM-dependent methyltransferase
MPDRRGNDLAPQDRGRPWGWSLALIIATLVAAVALWRRARAGPNGPRWYSVVYRTFYVLGLRIWERDAPPPDLVELVEGSSALAPDGALDLGCGAGTDSIYLAQHGWNVTGVDMVPEALAIGRDRAAAAGVTLRLLEGDVTRLRDLGVGDGYTLLLDFGCFHTLPPDLRNAYVESVSAVAAPGATFLLYGFARPPRLAPMQAGVTMDEVRERFATCWELVSGERMSADQMKATVVRRRIDASFDFWRCRLRRLA